MTTEFILCIMSLFFLAGIGMPIAYAIMLASFIYLSVGGQDIGLSGKILLDGVYSSFILLAVPLFIIAANIMNAGTISDRLLKFCVGLVGRFKGGMGHVNVVASLIFSGMSGSAVADAAGIGKIIIDMMTRTGHYTRGYAAAITAASATIGPIIPPSIPMIVYAVMSQSSVVQLFVAGIVPGVIGGFFLMLAAYITARRRNFPVEETFNLANVRKTAREAALAFLLPVIILGGIFGGVVTATEGAGLAVVASLVIGLVYGEVDFKRLYEAATEGAIQTSSVMLLVAASVLLGEFLTVEQLPQKIAGSIMDFTNNKYAVLAILNVFLLVIGFFLHSVAAIILTVPIVMPLVYAVGIDPVHFGIIVTLNLAIGQQTPPVASVLATACSVAKEDIWDVTRENLIFISVLVILLLLVTYVPAIPMTLVEYFYRS